MFWLTIYAEPAEEREIDRGIEYLKTSCEIW